MNPLLIGIEIGGTKLQVGAAYEPNSLVALVRGNVDQEKGGDGIREQLQYLVRDVLEKSNSQLEDVGCIGIGFGGPIDARTGTVYRSYQISAWDNFPIKAWAEETWGKPVVVENDASSAGLAEARYGAGKNHSRIFYMTVGSGIGGCWLVDQQIDQGQGLGTGEIGHSWVPVPNSGELVELELFCSGWAIGERARVAARQTTQKAAPQTAPQSEMTMLDFAGSLDAIDAKAVYAATEAGDQVASKILSETCQVLGLTISNLINILHPERVILGGGVSLMGPLFWDKLHEVIDARAFPPFGTSCDVVRAELGEEVVVIGALSLCILRSSTL